MTQTIPYNPENGIAELINRTLMDGAQEVLSDANMALAYWPYDVADVALKRIILTNSTKGCIALNYWTEKTDILPLLHLLGQIDRAKNLPVLAKLLSRSKLARYIGI